MTLVASKGIALLRQEAQEVLDGLMLGDGSIRRYLNTAQYSMNQSKHTILLEDHLKWEYWLRDNVFAALSIHAAVKPYRKKFSYVARLEVGFQVARLSTVLSPLLIESYDEWYCGGEWIGSKKRKYGSKYIRGATKVIPERIMEANAIPTRTLAHWFLGDGESSLENKNRLTPQVHIGLATYCFTKEEVYHLIFILNKMGLETTKPREQPHESGSGLGIRLTQGSVNDFIDLVEDHIMEIFGDSPYSSYKDKIIRKSQLIIPRGVPTT